MKKFRLKLQNLKLSVKLIIMIISGYLILLITENVGRQIVYEAYDEQLYMKAAQVCISYASKVETEIDKIENVSFAIIGDPILQEKLINLKKSTGINNYNIRKEILTAISSYVGLLKYHTEINVLLPEGRWLDAIDKLNNLDEYVQSAKEKKGKTSIFSENNKIGVFREIRRIQELSLEHLGVLFIQADLKAIMRELEDGYSKNEAVPDIFIYDGEEYIYASDTSREPPMLVEEATLVGEQFIVPYKSSELGWVFIVSIPYGEINESIRQADLHTMVLCFATAILVCVLSSCFVYSLMPHINNLMKKFELFGAGEIPKVEDYPSYEGRTDEFGRLHNQFDKMAQEYQRLTQESYQNMLLLKETQFQQLQQQIRPHFLFNTLSMISWTAAENDDMETARIVGALGRILRSSFSNTNNLVTIREEIQIMRDYLYIQKLRYEDRLEVEEVFDEKILNVMMPSFTIQPIIENVVVHVVEKSIEPCLIRVTGQVHEKIVEIAIEDSGGSLDENILKKLESGEVLPKGNGVGLSNVDARIKLVFSGDYGLSISSKKGCSKVTICIPYEMDSVKAGGYRNDKCDAGR